MGLIASNELESQLTEAERGYLEEAREMLRQQEAREAAWRPYPEKPKRPKPVELERRAMAKGLHGLSNHLAQPAGSYIAFARGSPSLPACRS